MRTSDLPGRGAADTAACAVDRALPGCSTGPAGRLGFVLREARQAWRASRARRARPSLTHPTSGGPR